MLDQLLDSHVDRWRARHASQWRNGMATYAKPLFDVAVGDIDTALVIKVIEPEWKRAPQTMDRVRRRRCSGSPRKRPGYAISAK